MVEPARIGRTALRAAGLLAAGLIAVIGCGRKDAAEQAADSMSIDSTAPSPSATKVNDPGHPGRPGEDDATRGYIARLKWVTAPGIGVDQTIPCHTGGGPTSGHEQVAVKIYPVEWSHEVDWGATFKKTGGSGHFVAKIVMGDKGCRDFRLAAGDSGLVWVGETLGTRRTAAIYRITRNGVAPNNPKLATVLRWCDEPHEAHAPKAVYRDRFCNNPFDFRPDSAAPETSHSHPDRTHDGGLWVSCTAGCCQVKFQT